MTSQVSILSRNAEETQQVGRVIGQAAQPGDVYLLTGPLGAGKTCLTQGIAQGLGVDGYVRSPTFVLKTQYRGRLTLHHMDLYRIENSLEAWDIGLEEQLGDDGVCVVEWADRAEELFSQDCLWVYLAYLADETERTISFPECSARYAPVLQRLAAAFPVSKEVNP